MSHTDDDCPSPKRLWERVRDFLLDVFNNVTVRVLTLIITGFMVAVGWINAAIMYIVQLFNQVIMSMPPIPGLVY